MTAMRPALTLDLAVTVMPLVCYAYGCRRRPTVVLRAVTQSVPAYYCTKHANGRMLALWSRERRWPTQETQNA